MFLAVITILSIGWLLVGIDTWIAARKDVDRAKRISEGNEYINKVLNNDNTSTQKI